jgi:AsmA protein
MKRVIKWLIITVSLLVLLIVAAPFIAINLVDPATIKSEVAAQVKAQTGRELTIVGDIVPTVTPWLGAEVGEVILGNAAGFDAPHFVRFKRANVRVKLMPLLSGNIEMDTVEIDGLDLNLARDANGVANWQDLVDAASGGSSGGGGDSSGAAVLAVGGLNITNGAVSWTDTAAGQQIRLRDLQFTSGALDLADLANLSIPLTTRFAFESNTPGVVGALALDATVSNSGATWRSTGTKFELNAAGAAVANGKVEMTLLGDLEYLTDANRLSGTGITLDMPAVETPDLAAAVKATVASFGIELNTMTVTSDALKLDIASFSAAGMTGKANLQAGIGYEASAGGKVAFAQPVFTATLSGGALGKTPIEITGKAADIAIALAELTVDANQLEASVPKLVQAGMTIQAVLKTTAQYNATTGALRSSALDLSGVAVGGPIGQGKLPFSLSSPLRFDAAKRQILAPGMTLKSTGFNVDGTQGSLTVIGDALFDIKANRLRSPKLALSGNLAGKALDGGKAGIKGGGVLDVNIDSGQLSLGNLDLQIDPLDAQGLTGNARVRGNVSGSGGNWSVKGLKLDGALAGANLPTGKLDLDVDADAVLNTGKGTLTVSKFSSKALGLAVSGNAAVSGLNASPVFKGEVNVSPFDLKKLLAKLGQEVPQTRDKNALRQVGLTASVSGTTERVRFSNTNIRLDDTIVRGTVSAEGFPAPRYRFDLKANGINVDNYMAPNSRKTAASPGAAAAAATTLPLDMLRSLNLAGNLSVGKLTFADIRTSAVNITANASGGLIRLNPLTARLYSGSYSGDVTLDARGKITTITVNEELANVALEPMLTDVNGAAPITGVGRIGAKLRTSGNNGDALIAGLNGDIGFDVRNGAIKKINIVRSICSLIGGAGQSGETRFDRMFGNGKVVNGVVNNPDLTMSSPLLRIVAGGNVDLPRQRLDYAGTASLVESCSGQGGALRTDLSGIDVPFRLSGPLDNPSPSVDIAALAAKQLTEGVGKKFNESVQRKITEKVGKSLGSEVEKVLGGALKGLFK